MAGSDLLIEEPKADHFLLPFAQHSDVPFAHPLANGGAPQPCSSNSGSPSARLSSQEEEEHEEPAESVHEEKKRSEAHDELQEEDQPRKKSERRSSHEHAESSGAMATSSNAMESDVDMLEKAAPAYRRERKHEEPDANTS